MAVLIFLCTVIGVLFISYYINKQEWDKEDNTTKPTRVTTSKPETHNPVITCKYLLSRVKWKSENLGKDYDTFLFNEKEFTYVAAYECLEKFVIYGKNTSLEYQYNHYDINDKMAEFLKEIYPDVKNKEQQFVLDFIKYATPIKGSQKQLSELLIAGGVVTNDYFTQWVEIGDKEYFADSKYAVYRFSDWKYLTDKKGLDAIQDKEIKPCEDPFKIHWEHFLELEMKAKKQRELDCHKFVDSVLEKQIKYNDLQLKYEMLPSAPITDIETFKNFCKLVSEKVSYEDYEIQNYLFLKRSKYGDLK